MRGRAYLGTGENCYPLSIYNVRIERHRARTPPRVTDVKGEAKQSDKKGRKMKKDEERRRKRLGEEGDKRRRSQP